MGLGEDDAAPWEYPAMSSFIPSTLPPTTATTMAMDNVFNGLLSPIYILLLALDFFIFIHCMELVLYKGI